MEGKEKEEEKINETCAKGKSGKLKVKVTRTRDGYYIIYNLSNPRDEGIGTIDYIGAVTTLVNVYGFSEQELDEETVRNIHTLFSGESLIIEKGG